MRFFFLSISFLLSAVLLANPLDSLDLDRIVQEHIDQHQFSGVVMVAKGGQPIYQRAAGVGDAERKVPITGDHHFSVASVTKLFTAVMVLRLVDRKELRLEQTVAELLPELDVPRAEKITVHHLLLHQSGLPNEANTIYGSGPLSAAEVVRKTVRSGGKNRFGRFNYNNVDYLLLGLIVGAKTQTEWREAVRREILVPLGLGETGFLAFGNYPEPFARTFSCGENGTCTPDPTYYAENFHAAASMYSTTRDLLRFDQALYDGELLTPAGLELLSRSYPENNYAGYSVWNYRYPFLPGQPTVMERRGGILGANVVLVRLTDCRRTIIILSNTNRFDPDSFGDPGNLREALIRAVAL